MSARDVGRICLVSASGQNVFFAEILAAFAAGLRAQGVRVEESVDCFPAPAEGLVYLFIPHEYVQLVDELAHPTAAQLRRAVALNVEQPGTPWFELAAEVAAGAGAVVDLNELAAAELRRRGIEVEHAPLGYVPAWDAWKRDGGAERPVDLTFVGAFTERRAALLARCAPALRRRRSEILLTEIERPFVAGDPRFLAGDRKWALLARSRLLLNVHQQELAYFEWHRVLGAVLNGCVVLSEHSSMTRPFVAGEHYFSAGYDDLPIVLEALLDEPERLERVRHAAYDLVRDEMPMKRAVDVLLAAAERAAEAPLPGGPPGPDPTPMPKPLSPRTPEWEAYPARVGDQLPLRQALRGLAGQLHELRRDLDELRRGQARTGGEAGVESFGPEMPTPRVSVLTAVHNHADLVGEALRSVALCDLDAVEVVVVDDASSDDSAEAVRAAAGEHPWLPVRLVRREANGGPAVARNEALEHARAPLLFILDADNQLLPQGLDLLCGALDADPGAAFAYGLLEAFDATGPVGLRSWMEWSAERLRYGNYVDAMAMIRRDALERIGGYPTDREFERGWEDFAAWVAMADAGLRGIRVPTFVGSYRVDPGSRTTLADIDHSQAWSALLRKYPVLTDGGAGAPPEPEHASPPRAQPTAVNSPPA